MSTTWKITKLGEILTQMSRQEVIDPNKQYRLLGIRLDGAGPFLRETKLGSEISANMLSRVESGDFIYSRLFAWRGAFGIIDSDLKGCYVSGEFPTFATNPDYLDLNFLLYWFRLPTTLKAVVAACTGSTPLTRNRFKEKFFLALDIPLPPLDEQQRIVTRVEQLAAKIEEANRLRKQAANEATALLNSAMNKLLAQADKKSSWRLGPIAAFAEINPSRAGNVNLSLADLVSFVPMRAVDDITGTIAWPETRLYNEVAKGYTWFKEGDVIFARITPCMQNGKAAIAYNLVNGVGFGSTEFHVIRPGPQIIAEWLYAIVRHKAFRDDAAAHFKGTAGQQRVPQSFLEQKEIPVPPLSEQHQLIKYINELVARMDALKRLQDRTATELDALLSSILDRAFKGGL